MKMKLMFQNEISMLIILMLIPFVGSIIILFYFFFVSFTYNFKVVGPEVVSTVHVCWNSDTVTPIIPGVQKNLRTRVNPEFGRKKKNKL